MNRQVMRLGPMLLLVAACQADPPEGAAPAQGSSEPASIIGISWQWTGTDTPAGRTEVAQPSRYTLLLKADGRAELLFDCNRGAGTYEASEGKLSFSPLIATRRACPEDTQDFIYMDQIQRVAGFRLEGGRLLLGLPAAAGTMRFERIQEGQ